MTSLADLGEFGFIARVAELAGRPPEQIVRGIGDDCAVMDVGRPEQLLITTDAALEGRHFEFQWLTPFEVGQRTVAGALSDIAAMGGTPIACLCTIAVPPNWPPSRALELMRGVADTGRRYGAPLVGGDTIAATDHVVLDVMVLGTARSPWLRSGAQVGDRLLLTGCLGEAAEALRLALENPEALHEERFAALRKRLADPVPRLREAQALAAVGGVHAAIDVSDGLYQDAGHIARESGVRLAIEVDRLPLGDHVSVAGQRVPREALWRAATSGEEYELLLSVDRNAVPRLKQAVERAGLAPLTNIGTVHKGEGVVLVAEDGSEIEMERGGWDHFRAGAG